LNIYKEIFGKIRKSDRSDSVVIIGLGNTDRADDGVGIVVSAALKKEFPQQVFVETEGSVEAIVLDHLDEKRFVTFLFVDAVDFGAPPGSVRLFGKDDIDTIVLPVSTHKVPISLLIDIINKHNREAFLLGIQPESMKLFGEITPRVRKIIRELESSLKEFLSSG